MMKPAIGCLLFVMAIAFLTGCRTAGPRPAVDPTAGSHPSAPTNSLSREGSWHSVEVRPRKKLPEISTWNKFNPVWWFGNIDDPVPPAWFRPDEKRRVFKWHLRNPFHNFTFYVIGIADKPHVRSGRYPKKVGNPNGGWNFAVAKHRLLRLPFLAYNRGKFAFYLGWRERGNLGAKINYGAKRPPKTLKPISEPAAPSGTSVMPGAGP